jgi:sugar lactone lactonase YvrE
MTIKTNVILTGLAFGESPRWHDNKLWFSDMHARKVMTIDLKGKTETIVEVPDRPSGLGWTPDGRLLVVSMKSQKLLRLDPAGLICVADLRGLASGDCNDMVVDASGRAYIGNFGKGTDLGKSFKVGPAEIVMVSQEGQARIAADDLTFPNGSVITPDGHTLIVAETFASRLTEFDIKSDGSLTNRRIWAPLATGIFPDGICLDAEGAVWVANAGGPAVYRVKAGGAVTCCIETSAHAYACMLGGAARRTLFILTAEDTDAKICREKMNGGIETVKVDVPGAGLP